MIIYHTCFILLFFPYYGKFLISSDKTSLENNKTLQLENLCISNWRQGSFIQNVTGKKTDKALSWYSSLATQSI